jgi:hypothetical protein
LQVRDLGNIVEAVQQGPLEVVVAPLMLEAPLVGLAALAIHCAPAPVQEGLVVALASCVRALEQECLEVLGEQPLPLVGWASIWT